MKHLLSILCLLGLLILTFQACQKDTAIIELDQNLILAIENAPDREVISIADLPEQITVQISNMVIETVYEVENVGFELVMHSGKQLFFSFDGHFLGTKKTTWNKDCMKGDSIGITDLPMDVIAYISDSLSGDTIAYAVQRKNGWYGVKLTSGKVLLFDKNGSFRGYCLKKVMKPKKPQKTGGNMCMKGDTIDLDSLPAAIVNWIQDSLPGDSILAAVKHKGKYYAASLSNDKVLLFDKDGNFLKYCDDTIFKPVPNPGNNKKCLKGEAIDVGDIPAELSDYVTDNYPNEAVLEAYVLPSGTYSILLSSDVVLVYLPNGKIKECK